MHLSSVLTFYSQAHQDVKDDLLEVFRSGASREELATAYLRLQYERGVYEDQVAEYLLYSASFYANLTRKRNETDFTGGNDITNGTNESALSFEEFQNLTYSDVNSTLRPFFSFGDIAADSNETCFVCCCPQEDAIPDTGNAGCLTRVRPRFCIGGVRDTDECTVDQDCVDEEVGGEGGTCVDEHPYIACFASEFCFPFVASQVRVPSLIFCDPSILRPSFSMLFSRRKLLSSRPGEAHIGEHCFGTRTEQLLK